MIYKDTRLRKVLFKPCYLSHGFIFEIWYLWNMVGISQDAKFPFFPPHIFQDNLTKETCLWDAVTAQHYNRIFQNRLYFFPNRIWQGLKFGSDAQGDWSLTVVMFPDHSMDRELVIYDWGYIEETLRLANFYKTLWPVDGNAWCQIYENLCRSRTDRKYF